MFSQIILLVVAFLCGFEYYVRYGRVGKYVKRIPGPSRWPIIGSLSHFCIPRIASLDKIWKLGQKWDIQFYPIWKFWAVHRAVVLLLHPDDIEKLLASPKHTQKSYIYNTFHRWLGTGLLTSHGAKWQKRRKMLTPAFHFNVLQQYFKSIIEHAEQTMEALKSKGEIVCDVNEFVGEYTLQVICETAMSLKFTEKHLMDKYRKAVHCIGQSIVFRITNPWFAPESIFFLTRKGQEYKNSLHHVHDFTAKMIKERQEFHKQTNDELNKFMFGESNNKINDDVHIGYRKNRLVMLDLLIAAQKNGGQIDDQGIQEEVDTFTFEGHDTSAAALTFAILLIAEHKDAQDHIRREIQEVLDQSNGKLGVPEVQRLTYLEMCIKECLRLYPSVQYISRYIAEDLQLTDYLVPKGSTVQIHIYSVHRVPEFWPDPEKFDPERFTPEKSKARHPYSYIPFSAGPRNCIGQKFAMMEMKVFMAYLVHNFYLIPIDRTKDLTYLADIVIRPAQPVYVKLVPIRK